MKSSVKRKHIKDSVLDKVVITIGSKVFTYHVPYDLENLSKYIKHAEALI